MRNLFVKGLFAASAVMMLASCNNEEGMDIQNGATSTVTVGVSVLTPETKAPITGDQVNQGTTVQDITNVSIVPMIGTNYQAPIVIGTVTAAQTSGISEEATISQDVDRFRVYGNVDASLIESMQGGGFTIAAAVSEDNGDANYDTDLYVPYGLYYYADADDFKVSESESDWASVVDWTANSGTVGTSTRVKIENVTYKVGVLGAGILLNEEAINDKSEGSEELCFEPAAGGEKVVYGDIAGGGTMDLKGLVIYGQPASLDDTFAQTGEVRVFAPAVSSTPLEDKLTFEDSTNKIKNANIYSVVAEEDGASIIVSYQFQNNTGYKLHLKDGNVVDNGGYVYYSSELNQRDGKDIFAAGYTTLLNGTINSWGNGTTTLPTTTDVQIGVIIETSWAQGISYEVNL